MSVAQILTLSCRDRPGITAKVTGFLFDCGANVLEAQQFNDTTSGDFFMRVAYDPGEARAETLCSDFGQIAAEFGMDWKLRDRSIPRKVLIMVSKFDHCLADLLYRHRIGELPMEITAIVSNHPREALQHANLRDLAFHHLPVTPETKPAQEARLRALIEQTGTELVVLARYMQVLSDELAGWLAGRCINIHHSFLPGFKGARPYHQAHA
ncbi:MAG: formyltetrahydrofolate deformylase, partial [Novosphingobium sp.]|nr:formyltetrahydrofolate deformylase [Novosphingobium sp.]